MVRDPLLTQHSILYEESAITSRISNYIFSSGTIPFKIAKIFQNAPPRDGIIRACTLLHNENCVFQSFMTQQKINVFQPSSQDLYVRGKL